jgi:hypothetical protein
MMAGVEVALEMHAALTSKLASMLSRLLYV